MEITFTKDKSCKHSLRFKSPANSAVRSLYVTKTEETKNWDEVTITLEGRNSLGNSGKSKSKAQKAKFYLD